jgi:hypothetical protein
MRFFIPSIGDTFQIESPWTFKLFNEYRNEALISGMKFDSNEHLELIRNASMFHDQNYNAIYNKDEEIYREYLRLWALAENFHWRVTLPVGDILKIDRIYIRKGAEDFDSVSFFLTKTTETRMSKVKGKKRFWAKLEDVNQLEVTKIE